MLIKNNGISDQELGSKIRKYLKTDLDQFPETDLSTPIMDSLDRDRYQFDDSEPMMIGGAKEIFFSLFVGGRCLSCLSHIQPLHFLYHAG